MVRSAFLPCKRPKVERPLGLSKTSHEISPRASLGRDDKGGALGRDDKGGALGRDDKEKPIIINSGYRSPQLNKKIGGVPTSNHFIYSLVL